MTDLTELFSRDPLKLTAPDIDEVILYMRQARERYLAGEKSAGAPKKMKEDKPKVKKGTGPAIDLGAIEDLL